MSEKIEFEATARPLHPIAGGELVFVILPDGVAKRGDKLCVTVAPKDPEPEPER